MSINKFKKLQENWSTLEFPEEFGDAKKYAESMHIEPFDYYQDRVSSLGWTGKSILDAGCGTGTWSFAWATRFEKVIGVDINQPRLAMANWLKQAFEIENVLFYRGDVCNLDFSIPEFDVIFCHGVVISYIPIEVALREFFRVLKPGGTLFICLNGKGWSMYLRDVRSKEGEQYRLIGKRGLYNTICQCSLSAAREKLIEIEKKVKTKTSVAELFARQVDAEDMKKVESFFRSMGEIEKFADYEITSLFPTTTNLQDSQEANNADDTLRNALNYINTIKKLLDATGIISNLTEATEEIRSECGDDYVLQLANDIFQILKGRQDKFSYANGGRGYEPGEVKTICEHIGFQDFQWAKKDGITINNPDLYQGEYDGHLKIWEFVVTKQGSIVTEEEEKNPDYSRSTKLKKMQENWSTLEFPEEFGDAKKYAESMHIKPFNYYQDRVSSLGWTGKSILDAGCGTGTWSFAWANRFKQVIGVDINEPRLAMANWLKQTFEIENVLFQRGDVCNFGFSTAEFDAIFCYSVVISYIPIEVVLREFFRVLKPGGKLFIYLNGKGWSMYLRDVRSKDGEKYRLMGERGLYNTVCQCSLSAARDKLIEIGKKVKAKTSVAELFERQVDAEDMKKVESFFRSMGEIEKFADYEITSLFPTTTNLQDSQEANNADDTLRNALNYINTIKKLLDATGIISNLTEATEEIRSECGDDYVLQLANDIFQILKGRQDKFSYANGGRGYEPGEVKTICEHIGFQDFQWAKKDGMILKNPDLARGEYDGHLKIWEFVVTKQGSIVSEEEENNSGYSHSTPVSLTFETTSAFQIAETKCGWSVELENRVGKAGCLPSLRRYPYPYRCAMAIHNDTDMMNFAAFKDWHDFVNGTEITPYGEGLGLEIGDSYWIWSPERWFSLYHEMPYKEKLEPSPETELISHLGKIGWLDTLHGFGDWREEWAISRDRILFALDRIQELGIKSTVYVNHGGNSNTAAHNIGGPWAYYQSGDLPGHRAYCLDLLKQFGFKYFWTDVCFELTKFGEHLTFAKQSALDSAVSQHNFRKFFRICNKDVSPDLTKEERVALEQRFFNRTLIPTYGRDRSKFYAFKRYRGEYSPDSACFAHQVNSTNLNALETQQGSVIIYQHLGVWRPLGCTKGDSMYGNGRQESRLPLLDENAVWAFRRLAERVKSGKLFLTTTGRLLDYLWVRDNLEYCTETQGDAYIIKIRGIECPVYGSVKVTEKMLQGITFKIPASWQNVHIEVEGLKSLQQVKRVPDPDDDLFHLLFIPWICLSYPSI
jgi:ubiquinone/menaquinone biosynthesis C-methylase UbiE